MEMTHRIKYGIVFVVMALFVTLDQWTKHLVSTGIHLGESIILLPFFNLTHARNQGAAFNFLESAPGLFRTPFFTIVPLVALAAIAFVLRKIEPKKLPTTVALALVASGALGNLMDRVRLGYVVDFLDFHWKEIYHFPSFNVADSCIVVGVALLFLQSLRESRIRPTQISTS